MCILHSYKLFTADVCTNAYFITLWQSPYETYIVYLCVCVYVCVCMCVCVKSCTDREMMCE